MDTKNTFHFFDDVYAVVSLIPQGKVTSYGSIARYLGKKMSARVVGWALHAAPKNVPAHRVVNQKGILTGKTHFSSFYTMQKRLEKEGVQVVENRILNFNTHFWDPTRELP